jgi:hypothetical protein
MIRKTIAAADDIDDDNDGALLLVHPVAGGLQCVWAEPDAEGKAPGGEGARAGGEGEGGIHVRRPWAFAQRTKDGRSVCICYLL